MTENRRIVHLFRRSIFLRYYIQFLDTYFNTEEHIFFVYGNDHSTTLPYPTCSSKFQIIETDARLHSYDPRILLSPKNAKLLNTADLVICHALIPQSLFLLFLHPKVLKKTVWVIWGGDITDYTSYHNHNRSKCLIKVYYLLKKTVSTRIPYVIARLPEYDVIKKYYNSTAVRFPICSLYSLPEEIKTKYNLNDKNKLLTNILIGHFASPTENHIEILNKLLRFKNEKIHLYLLFPYEFMNLSYANNIKNMAMAMYGDKVTIISDVVPRAEYCDFLNTIDVGILDAREQAGLGTIALLLSLGKKIFLNDCGINKTICDEGGYVTYVTSELTKCSFFELSMMNITDCLNNVNLSKKSVDQVQLVRDWTVVFDLANSIKKNK